MDSKENQNIEFKESWRDKYLKWICGFANAKVGTLYIGIDDSGKVEERQEVKASQQEHYERVLQGRIC